LWKYSLILSTLIKLKVELKIVTVSNERDLDFLLFGKWGAGKAGVVETEQQLWICKVK